MQSHASVAEYIAAQPRNRQAILKKVRATIRKAAGAGGGVVAFADDALWVNATPAAIWRVDPKRIDAVR
jgi:hypothetical protein